MNNFLKAQNFSDLFGESQAPRLVEKIFDNYSSVNWSYSNLEQDEFNSLIVQILKDIEAGHFDKSSENRLDKWVDGWGENLAMLTAGESVEVALKPKYYRKNRIVRFGRNWIKTEEDNLEWVLFQIVRDYLFEKYLERFDEIHEFGCGSVHNLYDWAKKRSKIVLRGYDWASSAVEIGRVLREREAVDLDVMLFNIFEPHSIRPESNNAVLVTIGALEQVGERYDAFLQFMRSSSFKSFVHVEPFLELYDNSQTLDFLAKNYSLTRGYLNGFLAALESLGEQGRIHLEVVKKIELGGRFHLGWNICVWSNLDG
ncbi:hypothetical protein N9W31_00515 [Litoricolaceae bacterium]|nr:hypothetical protein [Litorivicinaceae bacterium]